MTPAERARGLFTIVEMPTERLGVLYVVAGHGTYLTREGAEAEVNRLAAPIAAAISTALAERDAGEAERTAQAVARERHTITACLRERRDATDPALVAGLNVAINMIQLRARATAPAPLAEPMPPALVAALAEGSRLRGVIRTGGAMLRAERAILGVAGGIDPAAESSTPKCDQALEDAARKAGAP